VAAGDVRHVRDDQAAEIGNPITGKQAKQFVIDISKHERDK
jgi:hypothetical protein